MGIVENLHLVTISRKILLSTNIPNNLIKFSFLGTKTEPERFK